jgi:hypothetical protein
LTLIDTYFQCNDAVASKRYLEIIGGVDEKGKISKESQALIKTLESAQQSYNEKFKPMNSLDPDQASTYARAFGDATEMSHSGVLSIQTSAGARCGIVRLFRSNVTETSTISALTDRAVDSIIQAHGTIGWYGTSSSSAPRTEDEAPASSIEQVNDDDEEGEDEEGNAEGEGEGEEEAVDDGPITIETSATTSAMESVNQLGPNEKEILSKKVTEVSYLRK